MTPGGYYQLRNSFEIAYFGLGTKELYGEEKIEKIILAALSTGYRHIDVALSFGNLDDIGKVLEKCLKEHDLRRTQITISARVDLAIDDCNIFVRKQVEETLKRLKLTFLDIVIISSPYAPGTDDYDTKNKRRRRISYQELEAMHEERKIRTLGICDFEMYHVIELKCFCKYPPLVYQFENHPHNFRQDLLKFTKSENMFAQASTPLGHYNEKLVKEEVLQKIAAHKTITISELLLSWALHHGIGVLPRSVNSNRVAHNINACDVKLTADEINAIDKLDIQKSYR